MFQTHQDDPPTPKHRTPCLGKTTKLKICKCKE